MDAYEISTDPARLDVALIHRWLSEGSYWSKAIPREIVERARRLPDHRRRQATERHVAFPRVVTDKATFAYLAYVFVLEPHRGKGLSKRLMQAIVSSPPATPTASTPNSDSNPSWR